MRKPAQKQRSDGHDTPPPHHTHARAHTHKQKYVPLVVPTANADHLDIIPLQKQAEGLSSGFIVTNANCSSTGACVRVFVCGKGGGGGGGWF